MQPQTKEWIDFKFDEQQQTVDGLARSAGNVRIWLENKRCFAPVYVSNTCSYNTCTRCTRSSKCAVFVCDTLYGQMYKLEWLLHRQNRITSPATLFYCIILYTYLSVGIPKVYTYKFVCVCVYVRAWEWNEENRMPAAGVWTMASLADSTNVALVLVLAQVNCVLLK